ncbi:MAG: formimidoylglutamate deiminase, partial [Proteobacteria bacterium]|nr:formimidoylglutamate deiminase [Pseudomonadota bacterium]
MTKRYFADFAWLPHGWCPDTGWMVEAGSFGAVEADANREGAERLGRFALPGMPNLHSHAFQRAMAGLAERQTNPR